MVNLKKIFYPALEQIGHRFELPSLLLEALTHRSFGVPHNERLEFLGDSILNCAIAAVLYRRFPELREGELSRLRADLVRQETLAEIARALSLGKVLRLGEGELKSGGADRPSILADALEAVFAAVYLDAGFEAAQAVINRLFEAKIAQIEPGRLLKDPKTALQEWLQSRHLALPVYEMSQITGRDHAQAFEVICRIQCFSIAARGQGTSRRVAEQNAARAALNTLHKRQHDTND